MKFEKKMLRGSDFFLDFWVPDLAQILGFGALRGQFSTIEIQKTPKLFRPGGPAPLEPPAHPGPKGPRYEKNLPLFLPRNEKWKKSRVLHLFFPYIFDHAMIRREIE